ncbi:MAG: hypothetical protein JOY71_10420, partial [Acetobacteraceae bacterium]|nr:hypothetical protein [Acetobacteraceae bacterium]
MSSPIVLTSPRAAERAAAVSDWLRKLPSGAEALIVAPNWDAADDLLRSLADERGAVFAIHRLTLDKMISILAAETLAARSLAPAVGLTITAIAARAIHRLSSNGLGHFAPIANRHGFAAAVARTITELRLSRITVQQLHSVHSLGSPLAALLEQYERELQEAKLADRAAMIAMASAAIGANPPPRYVGLRTLFFDVPIRSRAEADFIGELAARAEASILTIAAGDLRTESYTRSIFTDATIQTTPVRPESSLGKLQNNLFETNTTAEQPRDDSVKIFSAPGEARECVEIAREIHTYARAGVEFDRMAILLRASAPYNAHLEEALARAGVPVYFARGTRRPEPGGRALLTLLNCAAERLSARRFAEYLSLAQVPYADDVADAQALFMPESDLMPLPESGAADLPGASDRLPAIDDPVPVIEGTLRAPWRWEELIVEASVIGGRERWRRRLKGLEEEFRTKMTEAEDHEGRRRLVRRLVDLGHLQQIALPIIDALDSLPGATNWGEWLDSLTRLTELAIRDRGPVLAALAELEPMAPIGPVGLDEVRLVLAERLGKLTQQPPRRRYGSVYVAQAEGAYGLSFDVVFIPGLAERLFPQKLVQDPILPDRVRAELGSELELQDDRRIRERLALKLAVGAAAKAVVLSYPRIDIDQGRPRVPSFYALEAMRAAEGRLRGFEELGLVASAVRELRLGWPAPSNPAEAIDNAEFDLALLE